MKKKQKVTFMVKSPKDDKVFKAVIETMPRINQVVARTIATSGVLKDGIVGMLIVPYDNYQAMDEGYKKCVERNKKYAI